MIFSCSHQSSQVSPPLDNYDNRIEIILANNLLTNVFEGKLKTNECIEDTEDSELLLKTLQSRFEEVTDSYQAKLDNDSEIENLIKNCEVDCSCHFLQDLFKENEIQLNKKLSSELKKQLNGDKFKTCTEKHRREFCQSELFKKLDQEKESFKFD